MKYQRQQFLNCSVLATLQQNAIVHVLHFNNIQYPLHSKILFIPPLHFGWLLVLHKEDYFHISKCSSF